MFNFQGLADLEYPPVTFYPGEEYGIELTLNTERKYHNVDCLIILSDTVLYRTLVTEKRSATFCHTSVNNSRLFLKNVAGFNSFAQYKLFLVIMSDPNCLSHISIHWHYA